MINALFTETEDIMPEDKIVFMDAFGMSKSRGDIKENPLNSYDENGRINHTELKRGTNAIE